MMMGFPWSECQETAEYIFQQSVNLTASHCTNHSFWDLEQINVCVSTAQLGGFPLVKAEFCVETT